ncbi:hypothetical protein BH92_27835 (plasmid) [Rhodococcoides fascians A21d2]|uniref:DUF6615 family protein n=1 Tax=Rhodococcoides fascians TaxID=1828 RepID=UPI000A57042F|nr:DUF6615 family protein [Rhodococcus fascians]QII03866.1 hypothetical protein BH92_27835 [Rhodococcus fascians A21d2]
MSHVWTVAEQYEVFAALLNQSVSTHHRIVAGEDAGIRQSEETITETVLLDLKIRLPNLRIATHTHMTESSSGADWEWWIEGDTRWFGMLVQAKKLHAINKPQTEFGYGFGYPPYSAVGDLQVDRLIDTAENESELELAPVYVLYNGTDDPTSQVHCPLRVVDYYEGAGGITAMSAYTVRDLARKNVTPRGLSRPDLPLAKASPHAIIWSCLATCGDACRPVSDVDPARRAAATLDMLRTQSRRSNDNPNDNPPETPLHSRPPTYVPDTVSGWGDGERPRSPIASHIGVLYRNRPDTDQ